MQRPRGLEVSFVLATGVNNVTHFPRRTKTY